MKKMLLLCMVLLWVSCKTVQVNQLAQKTTKIVVELGTIGEVNKKLETTVFQTTAVPNYQQKIRISANIVAFNNNTFNAYAKAATQQHQKIKVTYIDSVANKPGYANLQILDKVQLINELNAAHNKGVNAYLQNTKNNVLVTKVSAYFDSIDLQNISQAEEVYLINNKPQKYSLELVKNGKVFSNIDVSKAVPFAYRTSAFCWKKERGQISIANLVKQNESCARETYRNVAKLNKKIDYFKY
ncbi:hypothetical protein UMM65_03220 [Aureibaculum sp. 2210JD6-5]|uniref:hypothetical protein n=1 Tax=Aureibaculum sp. 2210JD6-5 TaxID=3103957 RepID=UPI002AACCB67|nr:hypothetical protein [Aureibaculum sp. 2210JD6-5]MDY7394238.1 hypothetical protein [Aureibaculum sp. 2210JD6-5]